MRLTYGTARIEAGERRIREQMNEVKSLFGFIDRYFERHQVKKRYEGCCNRSIGTDRQICLPGTDGLGSRGADGGMWEVR